MQSSAIRRQPQQSESLMACGPGAHRLQTMVSPILLRAVRVVTAPQRICAGGELL